MSIKQAKIKCPHCGEPITVRQISIEETSAHFERLEKHFEKLWKRMDKMFDHLSRKIGA